MNIRRLFFDLETSPNIGYFFKAGFKERIPYENIIKERAIICCSWKWAGQSKTHSLTWDEAQDDRGLLVTFLEPLNQADEIIGHNGDKFDLPWIRTRCARHSLPTFPAYKTIDTLAWARKHFYFNSNRLDYIASYFGLGGKTETSTGLWRSVAIDNDRGRLSEMVRYNKRDVVLLEQVFERLSAHVAPKTHVGVLGGKDKWTCAHCGSEDVRVSKTRRVTMRGTVSKQMNCGHCGRYYSISQKSHEEYLSSKNIAISC
jgi:hypothetical protein